MPHTFPKRRFRDKEIIDPAILTETFQDVAQKFAGHLNEHDFHGPALKAAIPVQDGAYYDAHLITQQGDPDWLTADVPSQFYARLGGSGAGTSTVATIDDSDGWQRIIADTSGRTPLSLTITCGEGDILVMFVHVQHIAWAADVATDRAADINNPLRLQYALRLDGVVFDNTITGAAVYPDPPPQQWYRATAEDASGTAYDYRHIAYLQGTVGLSNAVRATRVVYSAAVSSGDHTVDAVVRRLPPAEYKVGADESNVVQLFNRKLFVLRIKGMSPHSGESPSVEIAPFEDGQTLTAAQVMTDGFSVLSAAANSLVNANIERGAFHNEHLPSTIYGQTVKVITPSSPVTHSATAYPGYATNSAFWRLVSDGAGDNLEITGPTAGEWDLNNHPGTMVVVANVQLHSILWASASTRPEGIACFALRITNSAGTARILGDTECYVNGHSFNAETTSPTSMAGEDDAPLLWVVNTVSLPTADKEIAKIEVVVAAWDGVAGVPATSMTLETQRGILYAFVLEGVTTSA